MIAFASLVAAFLLIGILVLAAAFSGGRRQRPAPAHDGGAQASRGGGNALFYTGIAFVCIGIGLAIPFALMILNARDADRDTRGGVDLTAAQAKGRELFATSCATCHTLRASNSAGATGPNLDVLRPGEGLVENAIQLGRANGNGNMPGELLTGADAKMVASYVAAVAGRADVDVAGSAGSAGSTGTAVAGDGSQTAAADGKAVFAQNCASCHVMKAAGATGSAGPDLDKMLSADPASATRESIVDPNKEIASGYQKGIMPADFGTRLSKAELDALVAYVYKSTHK